MSDEQSCFNGEKLIFIVFYFGMSMRRAWLICVFVCAGWDCMFYYLLYL